VIAAIERLMGLGCKAAFGGANCDVLVEDATGEVKRVEVKATAEHAFQELKAKDLRADILVWIRFGRRFHQGDGPIEVALLNEPSRFFAGPCRVDTVRFERRIGSSGSLQVLSFSSLHELLGIVPSDQT
jgi:hypothetical protein